MAALLEKCKLKFNPFEPSASGAPVGQELWLPATWRREMEERLVGLTHACGVKAMAIVGEYGGGKSYLLQWLNRQWFPEQRIRPFYFDNPGVQFYDLANALLRQIGRKDFVKCVWELTASLVGPYQRNLFADGYEEYLSGRARGRHQGAKLSDLQSAIQQAGITPDDEIAYRLARMIEETPAKPYFEYRDFIAGKPGALVAEGEAAPYLGAILRVLRLGGGTAAIAFLIDEFEEVSLQKRLSRRAAHDYLATLRRLINLTQGEDLWVVVAMTPHGVEETLALEPSLWDRFTGEGRYVLRIPHMGDQDARSLIEHRLGGARVEGFTPPNALFPFADDAVAALRPATFSSPRRVVKVAFHAIAHAEGVELPLTRQYLRDIEENVYPQLQEGISQ